MSENGENLEEPQAPETAPTLTEYAERVIHERLDRMLSFTEGVRTNEQTEPVHQMRVWSRRTRAALDVFDVCFPGKAFHALEREVKKVTEALGEARDLDVMIEKLAVRIEALPISQRSGLEGLVESLRQQRTQVQHDVSGTVEQIEKHALTQKFVKIASKQNERHRNAKRAHEAEARG